MHQNNYYVVMYYDICTTGVQLSQWVNFYNNVLHTCTISGSLVIVCRTGNSLALYNVASWIVLEIARACIYTCRVHGDPLTTITTIIN